MIRGHFAWHTENHQKQQEELLTMADTTAAREASGSDFMRQVSMEHQLPYDVWIESLGIPIDTELPGSQGRPIRVVDHGVEPIRELFV